MTTRRFGFRQDVLMHRCSFSGIKSNVDDKAGAETNALIEKVMGDMRLNNTFLRSRSILQLH